MRARAHDLTPFLKFALKGIESQCRRLFGEIRQQIAKALFRNTMADLFGRLASPRKRVMSGRHIQLLNLLLDAGEMIMPEHAGRKRHAPRRAVVHQHRLADRDHGDRVLPACEGDAEGQGA